MIIHENVSKYFQGFDAFVLSVMQDARVPGLGLAIVRDTEVILEQGFGKRNVAENLEVTPQTLFAIGSATKAFTAMALAMLVDEGELDWHIPVRYYLPAFQLHDPVASERLTARDLLIHNSGLPGYNAVWYNSPISRKELVNRLRHFEPTHDLRTTWQYQNMMYMTAGHLVEMITGRTWEAFVQQRILEPLGMNSTNFSVHDSQQTSNFALPYKEIKDEVQVVKFYDRVQAVGPGGSINSHVQDMTRWVRCLLQKGTYGDGDQRLVSEAQFTQLVTPQIIASDLPTLFTKYEELFSWTYALGWFVSSYRGHTMMQHIGFIDGFSALVFFLPDDKIGAVILSNLDSAFAVETIAFNVCDRLLDLSEVPWHERYQKKMVEFKEQAEKAQQEDALDRVPDAPLTHPLSAYTGEFEHPGFGTFAIRQDGDRLQGLYNDLEYIFEHYHYDIFIVSQEDLDLKVKGSFTMNIKGEIEGFSADLEPGTKPIVFMRAPQ
jgi:CubicO group peptidase (beta-lactamase class C family)